LLLSNRGTLPGLAPALGTRFSGNGDYLGFAFDCHERRDGRRVSREMKPTRGPVITSAIRVPDALDGGGASGHGLYIEDAGIPAFVSWLIEAANAPGQLERTLRFAWQRMRAWIGHDPKSDLSGEIAAVLGPCTTSGTSLPLLGMGRDTPDGRMSLRDGWLEIDWSTASSMAYFERMRTTMRRIADVWQARFEDNPMWLLRRVITVHPLGGNPMGRSPAEGVVDSYGEVFNHPGLFVADGSVMPGPVGANPSLTIAALTDRFAERMLDRLPAQLPGTAQRLAPSSPNAPSAV